MRIMTLGIPFVVAGAVGLGIPAQTMASVISLNGLLTNPSFEGGSQANGCPVGWTCDAGRFFNVAIPTAAQYPTPNGLVAPAVTPSGTSAAFTPVAPNSVGTMRQTIAGQNYAAGNSYVLDFWLGNPSGGLFPGFSVQLLAGAASSSQTNILCDTGGRNSTLVSGAQSAADNGTQCAFSIPEVGASNWQPSDGDWRLYTLTFTIDSLASVPAGAGNIGVQFNVFGAQSAGNGELMHLDVAGQQSTPPQVVPEPATLGLLGLGLLGIGALRRSRA